MITLDKKRHDELKSFGMSFHALLAGLEAAVPIAIYDMRHEPFERRKELAEAAVDVVASQSDTLMYGSKKKGEVAGIFATLARGLAALAYQPGGVTFHGVHWCVDHQACVASRAQAEGVSV